MEYIVKPIGAFRCDDGNYRIELLPEYAKSLAGLEGFSHIQIIWWFDKCDDEMSRGILTEEKPYKKGPDVMGTFATRSPQRPNPIALSCSQITYIDQDNGVIGLTYFDACEGSPVLDIKPYTPSLDRARDCEVPEWCSNWPQCVEDSGEFDWESEFNF